MKSKKAIKRLTRVEKLLADVQFHYSAIEKPLGKLLSSAKASVAGIRKSIAAQAKTAKPKKSKKARTAKAGKAPAKKTAAPAKAKRRAPARSRSVRRKPAAVKRTPAPPPPVASALEVSTPS
jgi:hypothetical protein